MKSALERFCDRMNVRCEAVYGANKGEPIMEPCHPYRVTLRYRGRQLTTDFFCGVGIEREPTAADVLACLISDAQSAEYDSFEGWCANFGYDTDSRKAEQTYKACEALGKKVRRLLGDDFDDFARREH